MSQESTQRPPPFRWVLSLNVPVFLISVCGGMVMLMAPFEVHRLGGSATAMGGIGGLLTVTYIVACVLLSSRVDRFDPKQLVQMGVVLQGVMFLLLALSPNLTVLFVAAAVYGTLPGLVWPPVMGWISTGHEGPNLNRRLSHFNLSWSTGMMIGPMIGGVLYEIHHTIPFFSATVMLIPALAIIMHIPSPRSAGETGGPSGGELPNDFDARRTAVFRPLARIAIFLAYMAVGVFRFQLPSLALHLNIRTSVVGGVMMGLSIAMAAAFYVLGRTHRWHYRFSVLFLAQVILGGSVLALLLVDTWPQMAWCVIVGGLCVGVCYSSNLFYNVSGGTQRARLMAIHELLLSSGLVVGSTGGGWITDWISLRAAYPACSAMILAGLLAQMLLALRGSRVSTCTCDSRVPGKHT